MLEGMDIIEDACEELAGSEDFGNEQLQEAKSALHLMKDERLIQEYLQISTTIESIDRAVDKAFNELLMLSQVWETIGWAEEVADGDDREEDRSVSDDDADSTTSLTTEDHMKLVDLLNGLEQSLLTIEESINEALVEQTALTTKLELTDFAAAWKVVTGRAIANFTIVQVKVRFIRDQNLIYAERLTPRALCELKERPQQVAR